MRPSINTRTGSFLNCGIGCDILVFVGVDVLAFYLAPFFKVVADLHYLLQVNEFDKINCFF